MQSESRSRCLWPNKGMKNRPLPGGSINPINGSSSIFRQHPHGQTHTHTYGPFYPVSTRQVCVVCLLWSWDKTANRCWLPFSSCSCLTSLSIIFKFCPAGFATSLAVCALHHVSLAGWLCPFPGGCISLPIPLHFLAACKKAAVRQFEEEENLGRGPDETSTEEAVSICWRKINPSESELPNRVRRGLFFAPRFASHKHRRQVNRFRLTSISIQNPRPG